MNDLPFLDLDAATQLYLPHATVSARAEHRFVYRAPNGDEEIALARLCQVNRSDESWSHCVILRPERAEVARIFAADAPLRHMKSRDSRGRLVPIQPAQWNWNLFAEVFQEHHRTMGVSRFWSVQDEVHTRLFRCFADGKAIIVGAAFAGEERVRSSRQDSFRWRCNGTWASRTDRPSRFSQITDPEFKAFMLDMWDDPQHEVHYALDWQQKTEAEKHAIAFECRNGTWPQLRAIAALVLQVRLSRETNLEDELYEWNFTDYGRIAVRNLPSLDGDQSLLLWRQALTHAFDTPNFSAVGTRIDSLPRCLWIYADSQDDRIVEVGLLSAHELMEANLKLQAWARQHFTEQNARILMASLSKYSPVEAHQFLESLKSQGAR